MQGYFFGVIDYLRGFCAAGEEFHAWFQGEESAFVRFRQGRVGEAGTVFQRQLALDLRRGRRHAAGTTTLSGSMKRDRFLARALLGDLHDRLEDAPEDPHLLLPETPRFSERRGLDHLRDPRDVARAIVEATAGRDLAGLYAAGPVCSGFATTSGQRNWFSAHVFHFDASLLGAGGAAVKLRYAGERWEREVLGRKVDAAERHLALLERPQQAVAGGEHRVYLTPPAMCGLLMLVGAGFGARALRVGASCLLRMERQDARFDERVSIAEETERGLVPDFDSQGFAKPGRIALVAKGKLTGALVSAASAAEFGLEPNGAGAREAPASLAMDAGGASERELIGGVERGLYIDHLHYLAFSDRSACRVTGATRYACFRIEGGELVAPLATLRIDASLYEVLGSRLVELSRERELLLDPATYGSRSTASILAPGALADGIEVTAQ